MCVATETAVCANISSVDLIVDVDWVVKLNVRIGGRTVDNVLGRNVP